MGYIGNQQTEGYSQVPPKQDLTGATGTTLTLSNAVASAEGIDLFINNVRQEPTEAYSVVGTAVTLTGSVVATDDIYVVYNSLALQTTVPPDASVSTAKIIDGNVTSAKLDTNIAITGDLTVDTSTLKVDSTNNRVGIGTASPNNGKLEVTHSSSTVPAGYFRNTSASGDSPSLTVQGGANNAAPNFSVLDYNGNTDFMVQGSGNVLIGGTSLTQDDHAHFESNGVLVIRRASGNGRSGISFANGTTNCGNIILNTSSTQYNTSSDYRLKENVVADWDATTRLKQLNPVRFNFIADADTTVDGFLAHEVQSVVPEAISGTHDEVDDEGNPVYQGIDQSKLVPLLVKTIQELEARITALEAS